MSSHYFWNTETVTPKLRDNTKLTIGLSLMVKPDDDEYVETAHIYIAGQRDNMKLALLNLYTELGNILHEMET